MGLEDLRRKTGNSARLEILQKPLCNIILGHTPPNIVPRLKSYIYTTLSSPDQSQIASAEPWQCLRYNNSFWSVRNSWSSPQPALSDQ